MPSWRDIFWPRTQDWVFSYLSAEQVPDKLRRKPVAVNSEYLSITLQSARVVNVRRGLTRFYGTVHSYASIPHLSGGRAEFQVVTSPDRLKNVDPRNLDRVISLEHRLVGPVPYRGGDLELEIGLFSIKSVDLAAPFISLLEDMSKLAGVAFIGTALPFAAPIKTGINLLTGGNDPTILETGVAASSWRPEVGYIVVMRAPKSEINVEKLHVHAQDYRLVDLDGRPVGDFPYMVLKVETSPRRDDWYMIPDVSEAYSQLRNDLRRGVFKAAAESLTVFRLTALNSDDLLEDDANRIVELVEAEYNKRLGTTATGREESEPMPELRELPLYPTE